MNLLSFTRPTIKYLKKDLFPLSFHFIVRTRFLRFQMFDYKLVFICDKQDPIECQLSFSLQPKKSCFIFT